MKIIFFFSKNETIHTPMVQHVRFGYIIVCYFPTNDYSYEKKTRKIDSHERTQM